MSRADKFYRMCTTLPADELWDERDETFVPELVDIAKRRDSGALDEAIEYGNAIVKMYPDYDLVYYMVAHIHFQRDDPAAAMQLALEGIPNVQRKYRLYAVAGLAEYDRGRLANALVWWCRSVVAQALVSDFQEYEPYLHLGAAAELLRMDEEMRIMTTMVDAIEPQVAPLSPAYLQRMDALRSMWVKAPFTRALSHIVDQYYK